jgi:osmoprotectant transport system ATP-binding protein
MIEIKNLSKKFGDITAVDDVSFEIKKGEVFVLLGTSGCGKTTTLRMINRLVEPSCGKIKIDGYDIGKHKSKDLRKQIGYVIQNIGLFPHYTVEQNIAVVPGLLKWDKKRTKKRVLELMELMGLKSERFLSCYPASLSGGQKQRVGLARALAADPPIILLDEPFGALDSITREQIRVEFKNLESLLCKTMVLVTHDVLEAFDLGDRICLMDKGKIQQTATSRELIFSPKNQFVEDFFKTNRFQLELKVLTLKDVLPVIKKEKTDKCKKGDMLKDSDSLLKALKVIKGSSLKDSIKQVKDTSTNFIWKTSAEEIMSGFCKVKHKLSQNATH